ncbi:MAG: hypothetical protein NZ839_02325, partial [Endomicrobia bacterium]|nr:hypothetical protein [Endomicrobiia bacterium]
QAKPEGKIHLFWDTVSGLNVSYYNIYRSTFAVVNSYSEKISSTTYNYFIDTTTTEGTRYYYCITAVVDGVESNESNIVNEIADASSPNINILTGGILGLVGIGYRVKATITDTYHLVGGATLYYCIDGSTTWYNTYMFKSEDNTWVGEIPSKFITLSGVRFYIKAEDTAGNIAVLPELNPEINSFKIDVISSLKIYVFPNKAATILLPDETELYITTSAVSVDDVLQVRIPQNVPHVQEGLVSPPADVKEFYFVSGTQRLAKECSLILPYSLKDSINEHKLRIYLWDTNKWVYVDSTVNLYKKVVSGKINRLGLYAVIADTIPPVITNLTPTTGDILPKRPVVAANIYDTGSGIEINSIKFVVSYPAGTKTTQVVITTISYPSNEIIVSDNSVKFIPLTDYIPGYTYTIELYVGDKSGNIAKHTVNFKVGSEPLLCTYSYPNPFDPLLGVNIKYILNEQMKETKIKIYNVEGKVIKVLNGSSVAGVNIVFWDGRDDNGNIVNSEVFLCHIQVKDMNDKIFKKVIKMLAWR